MILYFIAAGLFALSLIPSVGEMQADEEGKLAISWVSVVAQYASLITLGIAIGRSIWGG